MHLRLNMVVVGPSCWMEQSCHLDVLDLRLVVARSLSCEELLLVGSEDARVNFTGLGSGTLGLGELRLSKLFDCCRILLLYLDVSIANGCLLSRWLQLMVLNHYSLSLGYL